MQPDSPFPGWEVGSQKGDKTYFKPGLYWWTDLCTWKKNHWSLNFRASKAQIASPYWNIFFFPIGFRHSGLPYYIISGFNLILSKNIHYKSEQLDEGLLSFMMKIRIIPLLLLIWKLLPYSICQVQPKWPTFFQIHEEGLDKGELDSVEYGNNHWTN